MVSDRLRLSRRRRSRCDSECESVRRAAHGSRWPQSVLACGIPSDLQVASAENTTPLVTQYMHPPPRSTLGSAGVAGGSTRVWRVKPPRGQGRQTPSPRAFRAEWGTTTRQVFRDARRRRRGADTTKRTTTIGRYSSARPEMTQTSKEPSGSRPRSPPAPGPLVDHRPSTPRRAP